MSVREQTTGISRALKPLQDVVASLAAAAGGVTPEGNDKRRVVRRVRAAGMAAVPTLLRALGSPSEVEAGWARYLLGRLGGPSVGERVARFIEDPRVTDEGRARALALLADLNLPDDRVVTVPESLLASSVVELLESLDGEVDVKVAVDLIASEIPVGQVVDFAEAVARHGGSAAAALLDALVERTPPSSEQRALSLLRRGLPDARSPGPQLPRLRDRPRSPARVDRDRAIARLLRGDLERARVELEAAITATPDDDDALAHLGVCLLRLGDPSAAVPRLARAAALAPDVPLHHWNLAIAARATDRLFRTFDSLERYLDLDDTEPGARGRRREARRFLRDNEALLRCSYPGTGFDELLDGEERFQCAFEHLSCGRIIEACVGFRAVLEILPLHYPSWGNLGAAELAQGHVEEAARCLRRALELNPDYEVARENLALLDTLN